MSYIFRLKPDAELLFQCGYLNHREDLTNHFDEQGNIDIIINAIWTEEQRKEVEHAFLKLTEKYAISDHYDSLLAVCLVESDTADRIYQASYDTYNRRLRDKQLAQFLSLYNPESKHNPNNLKLSTLTETVKITDPELLDWIGTLVRQWLEEGRFKPGIHGESLFNFVLSDNGTLNSETKLNYPVIEAIADKAVKKPSVRDRNRLLASFLLKVWNVLDNATSLTTEPGTRFSDGQLKFLFGVAEIFRWLSDDRIISEPKDYLYTLLMNEMKRK